MINLNLNALYALNQLTVVNRDYNLQSGFFWVEFDDGRSLQCCLAAEFCFERERDFKYLPQVSIYDTGYYEGLSRDNNCWAAGEDGSTEHIEEFLIEQARQCGLQIVV